MKCESPNCKFDFPDADEHHIVNQGIKNSGGCNCRINKVRMCRGCHSKIHAIGRYTAFEELGLYDRLMDALDHRNERNHGMLPCSPKWTRPIGMSM